MKRGGSTAAKGNGKKEELRRKKEEESERMWDREREEKLKTGAFNNLSAHTYQVHSGNKGSRAGDLSSEKQAQNELTCDPRPMTSASDR